MKLFVFIFVIFCVYNESYCELSSLPQWPALPSLSNTAMIKHLLKFYTLRSESKRSELCEKQSKLLYNGVQNSELWAQRIVDASAKLPNGIAKLHVSDVGYFDECIRVKNDNIPIMGKYCLSIVNIKDNSNDILYFENKTIAKKFAEIHSLRGLDLFLESGIFYWAICVPNECTAKEVEDHLNTFAGRDMFEIKSESQCQTIETYKSKFNAGDWIVISGLIFLCVIIVLSTAYDVYLYYTGKATAREIFIAFSWFTNYRKLIKINNDPDMLSCLNGIRTISMLWIVIAHQYENERSPLCTNITDAIDWLQKFSSMFIIGASVCVDTFFLLGGCVLMYGFLRMQAKKVEFNIPMFYLHRYLRLTPSYAAAIVIMATILRNVASGPFWNPDVITEPCQQNWWAALLYIQNFIVEKNFCIGPTWYLQIDMQLYIVAPLILIPIQKWPKIAVYLLSTLVVIFVLIPTIYAWHYKLAVYWYLFTEDTGNADHYTIYYNRPYTRAAPWVLGLLLGYFIYRLKEKKNIIRLNRIFVALFWIISIIAMFYCMFGFYSETQPNYKYDRLFNTLFIGLHRTIWSAGLSWIIFACVFGYGGPINWFLSLPIFQIFSKICYSLYLVHEPMMIIRALSLQMPFIFSNTNVWNVFCSTTVNALIISFMWTLTFESPFIVLDTILRKSILDWKKQMSAANAAKQIS